MNPETTNLILGPPGTGKTHELLRIAEGFLDSGLRPDEICFVAFTRKAANEARTRAAEKFNLNDDQLMWFRTLHSLAFHQLGLSKHTTMGISDYVLVARLVGVMISFRGINEDGTVQGMTKGDRLFFMENMARAQLVGLKEYWEKFPNEDIYWYELQYLHEVLVKYKIEHGKCDFTDMMHDFNRQPVVPDIRALIVDEAQDLTPLQWQMVEHLAENVEETYIAGDDDQAIFTWAGADIRRILTMPGTRRVLPRSYRVPRLIQEVAERVVSRITERIPKEWESTKEDGAVHYEPDLEHIDMSAGTWLLLARNVYLLQRFNDHCLREGYLFSSHLGSPVRGPVVRAIRAWEEVRRGGKIRTPDARVIFDHMSSGPGVQRGFKGLLDKADDKEEHTLGSLIQKYGLCVETVWHQALDRIPDGEREYFIAALRRGEKLLREPRIRIETIHGVKGGEADHVVICTDMAERTWQEYHANPDAENRVWYVGVTRARKSLHILSPKTNRHYDI